MAKKTDNEVDLAAVPDFSITAGEMAEAISVVATKLHERGLVEHEGFGVLMGEVTRLRRKATSTSWEIQIDRSAPVVFASFLDKNNREVFPQLVCAGISVVQGEHEMPPFASLDIAIEIFDENRAPVARWHVDLANTKPDGTLQPGPLTHLQYGGHFPDHRDKDHPLKAPRWCHPPMELTLLCEVMAANFYEGEWEQIREDRNWCRAITVGQKLCYSSYLRKMVRGIHISSKTLLHSMWGAEWSLCS